MADKTVKAKYQRTLKGYLRWAGEGSFLRPPLVESSVAGPSAAVCMKRWESEGIVPTCSSEPELLARYAQGKVNRDWHITEWKDGIRMGLFVAEEFIGTLGCDKDNFTSIFGRAIRPAVLEVVHGG